MSPDPTTVEIDEATKYILRTVHPTHYDKKSEFAHEVNRLLWSVKFYTPRFEVGLRHPQNSHTSCQLSRLTVTVMVGPLELPLELYPQAPIFFKDIFGQFLSGKRIWGAISIRTPDMAFFFRQTPHVSISESKLMACESSPRLAKSIRTVLREK